MYLVDYYGGPQAGTEGQLLQLIQHLDRSRYEPAMTLLRSSDYIERTPLCCPVRIIDITRLASVRSIFRVLCFALSMRREGYRLVHCFLNDVSLIAPPLLRMFGVRVLLVPGVACGVTPPRAADRGRRRGGRLRPVGSRTRSVPPRTSTAS